MQIIFLAPARRGLKRMPLTDAEAIVAKLASYAATGVGDVRKLAGEPGFRLRHGDWRAIFVVVRIAHRREVYR